MNQSQPLVSVIIPVYNDTQYLLDSISSVFSQSYSNLEIVVIDDGSVQPVEEYLRQQGINNSKLEVLRQDNKGLPAARNAGLAHVRGEYVVFLDSDDLLCNEKISHQVDLLSKNSSNSFVFSDEYVLEEDGSQYLLPNVHPSGATYIDLFLDCRIAVNSCLCRTEQAKSIGGFDVTLLCNEDDDFWFRIAAEFGDALYDSYVSSVRRMRTGSMSKNLIKMYDYIFRTWNKNYSLYQNKLEPFNALVQQRLSQAEADFLYAKSTMTVLTPEEAVRLGKLMKYVRNVVLEQFVLHTQWRFIFQLKLCRVLSFSKWYLKHYRRIKE